MQLDVTHCSVKIWKPRLNEEDRYWIYNAKSFTYTQSLQVGLLFVCKRHGKNTEHKQLSASKHEQGKKSGNITNIDMSFYIKPLKL